MGVGGYFCGGFNCALCVRSDDTVAYLFWVEVALDTGAFFRLPGSGVGDHQLPGVSRIKWKCVFFFSSLYVSDDVSVVRCRCHGLLYCVYFEVFDGVIESKIVDSYYIFALTFRNSNI